MQHKLVFWGEGSLQTENVGRDHGSKISWKTRNSKIEESIAKIPESSELLPKLYSQTFRETHTIVQIVEKRPGNTGPVRKSNRAK